MLRVWQTASAKPATSQGVGEDMVDEDRYVEDIIDQDDNFSQWYNQVVRKAELADYAPVRGCMIIRPYGYAIWENIQRLMDARFKETDVLNAYFPLLIPRSFIEKEAEERALMMLEVYRAFAEEDAAMPVIVGRKSENEKFAGALRTYTIEALMGDGKALQAGTSHNLGTNFAESFDIQYLDADGLRKYCATTSWGASTRLIGGLIMVHGDNAGLILPPHLAPYQVVIVPIWRNDAEKPLVGALLERVEKMLKGKVRVKIDLSENTPGWKFNEWELRGVPVRMEIGPRDVKNNSVMLVRRDNRTREAVAVEALETRLPTLLEEVQKALFQRAKEFQDQNTHYTDSYEEFKQIIAEKRGFVRVTWAEDSAAELAIKGETKATLRAIPFDQPEGGVRGKCFYTGKPATCEAIFARAY